MNVCTHCGRPLPPSAIAYGMLMHRGCYKLAAQAPRPSSLQRLGAGPLAAWVPV